jgi:hypothetical protein
MNAVCEEPVGPKSAVRLATSASESMESSVKNFCAPSAIQPLSK